MNASDREPEITLPTRPVWVYLAFAFTLLYMSIHLYWAVGGTWGLPLLALHDKSAVQAVDWVVCVIMVMGVGIVVIDVFGALLSLGGMHFAIS